jgi:hypothetical protein
MNSEPSIEEAEQELHNLFGSGRDWEIRVRSWIPSFCVYVHTYSGRELFQGKSIAEALSQVRAKYNGLESKNE